MILSSVENDVVLISVTNMKIYLAGFDVFRQNALDFSLTLKACCADHGYIGMFPMDNIAPAHLIGPPLADWIFRANTDLIRTADIVMANLNPFRGREADSGTAFEVGYAHALGLPVWGYLSDDRPMVDKLEKTAGPDGAWIDSDGLLIENFGLPVNLMLACSARLIRGDAFDCIRAIAASGQS